MPRIPVEVPLSSADTGQLIPRGVGKNSDESFRIIFGKQIFLLFLEYHLKYSLSQACVISKFSDTFIWPRCLAFADWVRFNLAKSPESVHNGHGASGAAPRSGVFTPCCQHGEATWSPRRELQPSPGLGLCRSGAMSESARL